MKKYFIVILFSVTCVFYGFSQEYDFFKHAYKVSRAADHENDPRLFHYDVGFYFLNLEMDNSSVDVAGNVRIDLNLLPEYNNELVFDLKSDMYVDSVKVNDALQPYTLIDDQVIINYIHTDDFNEDYNASAIIYYHGTPSAGMFNQSNWYSTNIYTFTYSLSEPYSAKYWFPCKQVLSDKADSSYVYVTIPDDLKVGSNGIMVNEVALADNKKRMEWQSSYPIDFYLISVAIGDYQDFSFYSDMPEFSTQILVQNYIPNNATYLDENTWYIYRTTEMLQLLSNKLGLYPHHEEKYGHCIVPLNGGMEHQTMTTLGSFSFRLVIHELSHSWFGDYLTCDTWQDIWINEGFASYGEYLGEQYIQGESYALGWLNECQGLAKEATEGSVYVPFEELSSVSRVFDYRLSYRKGACLVHMIRYIMNDDEMFFAALQEYLSVYGNSTATAEDYKAVMESESGIDFDAFFEEWYYGEGYPIYSALWWQNGGNINIELNQSTTAAATSLFTIPMEFEIVYDDETSFITRQNVDANYCTYQIPVTGNVVDVIVNPNLSVLADVSSIQNLDPTKTVDLMKVFPNPSDGKISLIASKPGDYTAEIYNSEGALMEKFSFSGNSFPADLSQLSDGIYTIKISSDSQTSFEKIVISN